MIKRHWSGILQWKLSSINNSILEGLNSVIQAAKRKARGYGKKLTKGFIQSSGILHLLRRWLN
jgi:hypothetical protein